MKRPLLAAAILLWMAPGLIAQKGAVATLDDVTNAAKAEFDKFTADFDAAMKAYRAERKKVSDTPEYKAAVKARDRQKVTSLMRSVPPFENQKFVDLATAAAKKYANTEGAVNYLSWLVASSRDSAVAKESLTALIGHAASSQVKDLVERGEYLPRMASKDAAAQFLEAVIEKNPDTGIKAQAMFATATTIKGDKGASDEAKAKAEAMLESAASLASGTLLEKRILAPKFQAERLQIGMEVPDIVGKDLDGVDFKLSDYRGKVVVLDFWGDW